ncbi:hypothetical protein EDC01DRAFT_59453 [Geopyxis carbonaria]|nr:hypothetical protein EDC01DRAFT_59453 [Geopyxis carbonaria]
MSEITFWHCSLRLQLAALASRQCMSVSPDSRGAGPLAGRCGGRAARAPCWIRHHHRQQHGDPGPWRIAAAIITVRSPVRCRCGFALLLRQAPWDTHTAPITSHLFLRRDPGAASQIWACQIGGRRGCVYLRGDKLLSQRAGAGAGAGA